MGVLKLRLAVICRYTHRVENEHWVAVSGFREAKDKVGAWVDEQCFENWQFLGGDVKDGGKIVGIFSQNGVFWEPSDKGNDCYERLMSDRKIDILP